MGLLDDAIREHLDLKRRRGADPLEVERDEREALGPVRRAPAEAPPRDEADEDGLGSSFAYDQEQDEDGWSRDAADEDSADAELEYEDDEADDEPDFAADIPDFDPEHRASDPDLEHALDPDTEHESHAPSHRRRADETVEYNVEDALDSEHDEADPGASDEDVLEETPEFLQDTPDHDRLWFEQRPPKDFDFDG